MLPLVPSAALGGRQAPSALLRVMSLPRHCFPDPPHFVAGRHKRDRVHLGPRAGPLEDVAHPAAVRHHAELPAGLVLRIRLGHGARRKPPPVLRVLDTSHAHHAVSLLRGGEDEIASECGVLCIAREPALIEVSRPPRRPTQTRSGLYIYGHHGRGCVVENCLSKGAFAGGSCSSHRVYFRFPRACFPA